MKNAMKGQAGFSLLTGGIKALGLAAILTAFILLLLTQTNVSVSAITGNNSSTPNVAILAAISGIAQVPTWFALLVLIVVFVVIFQFFRLMSGGMGE